MKIICTLKRLANYFILNMLLFFKGKKLCKRLFPQKSKKNLYVLPFQGIGDSMITLGFLKEFMLKNDFLNAMIFHLESYSELYSFYDFDFAEKKVVSKSDYSTLRSFFNTRLGLSYLLSRKDILYTDTAAFLAQGWKTTFSIPSLSVFEYIRSGIMALNTKSKISLPSIPQTELQLPAESRGKKIAVLNPYSKTILISTWKEVYERIARLLLDLNYFVFTDCGKDKTHKAVSGTTEFYGTLSESVVLCKKAELVIATRSGWVDLMMLSGTKVVALYGKKNEIFMNAFDVKVTAKMLELNIENCVQMKTTDVLEEILGGKKNKNEV